MGGGTSSLPPDLGAKLSSQSIQIFEEYERKCSESTQISDDLRTTLTEKYEQLLALELSSKNSSHKLTEAETLPLPKERNIKEENSEEVRKFEDNDNFDVDEDKEDEESLSNTIESKKKAVKKKKKRQRRHSFTDVSSSKTNKSGDKNEKTMINSTSTTSVKVPQARRRSVVVTAKTSGKSCTSPKENTQIVEAVEAVEQLSEVKETAVEGEQDEEYEYHCLLCSEHFATQNGLEAHWTDSTTHHKKQKQRITSINEAIKKTKKLELLALQAIRKYEDTLLKAEERRKSNFSLENTSYSTKSCKKSTFGTENSAISIQQIRWKKSISEVMSKKLITQYHVLSQELQNVELFSTKKVKLISHQNKLFWKIKSRFLFLIYLHTQLNCIEVVIILLPSHDIAFHSTSSDKPNKHSESEERSSEKRIKRIFLKYNLILELCFGVRGPQMSALLANSSIESSTDLYTTVSTKNSCKTDNLANTLISFVMERIIIDTRSNAQITQNDSSTDLVGQDSAPKAKEFAEVVILAQTNIIYADYNTNNNNQDSNKSAVPIIDQLIFNDLKMNVSPVFTSLPDGLTPVCIEPDHIYAQWDVKLKLEEISQGKSHYMNAELNKEIMLHNAALKQKAESEDKVVPGQSGKMAPVRRWSFIM